MHYHFLLRAIAVNLNEDWEIGLTTVFQPCSRVFPHIASQKRPCLAGWWEAAVFHGVQCCPAQGEKAVFPFPSVPKLIFFCAEKQRQ